MTRLLALLAALTPAAVFAVAALANGGATIATAVNVGSGGTYEATTQPGAGVEFYKVTLGVGDLLTVGYGVQAGFYTWVGACLLPPGTDDFTVSQSKCIHDFNGRRSGEAVTKSKVQHTYRSPLRGTYPIAIGIGNCVLGFGYLTVPCQKVNANSDTAPPTPYTMRVRVEYRTRISLRGPSSGQANEQLAFIGKLTGRTTSGKTVFLQVRKGRKWTSVSSATVGSNGSFQVTARLDKPGIYALRAFYPGDATHQVATAIASVRLR